MPALPRPVRTGLALLLALLAAGLVFPAAASAADPTPSSTFSTGPDPLARYVGQVSCDPTVKPGARAVADLVLRSYAAGRDGGITRACSSGGTSEHKEGRAFDWMLNAYDPAQRDVADRFLSWLTGPDAQGVAAGNARRLGVMYAIWNGRVWEAYRANETVGSGWKAYTGASPHTDHIHLSLSWDGAWQRTSWWTGTAVTRHDYGPCRVYVGEPAPPYSAPNYSPCPAPTTRQTEWWVRGVSGPSAGAPTAVYAYGPGGSSALACDFDGDGRDGSVVYVNGWWAARRTPTPGAPELTVSYGGTGMLPVCGDWDGDGKDGIGVYDGTTWWLRNTATPGAPDLKFSYGWPGAGLVVGDWDGDGTDTVGVYDGSAWWLRNSNTPGTPDLRFDYGWRGVRPVSGDWDGDGRDGIGIYAGGGWWLRNTASPGAPDLRFDYGWAGPAPVAGRWVDGGRDGVAIAPGSA